jgi:hypothetical protein
VGVDEAWLRQHQWSALADAKTTALKRWRWLNLGLVMFGAVAGVLAAQSWFPTAPSSVVAVVGAIALAVAAFVQKSFLGTENVKSRVDARAAAESIKAAVFRYLAGTAPYDGADRDARLDDVLVEVAEKVPKLTSEALSLRLAAEAPPTVTGVVGYTERRARAQLDYHDRKREEHDRLDKRWRRTEIAATLTGAVLSAFGARPGSELAAWVGVATTVAGAVAAHIASEQHARISASYAVTVERLGSLIRGFHPAAADAEAATVFVAGVEEVLAQQNQLWVSTLTARP